MLLKFEEKKSNSQDLVIKTITCVFFYL